MWACRGLRSGRWKATSWSPRERCSGAIIIYFFAVSASAVSTMVCHAGVAAVFAVGVTLPAYVNHEQRSCC